MTTLNMTPEEFRKLTKEYRLNPKLMTRCLSQRMDGEEGTALWAIWKNPYNLQYVDDQKPRHVMSAVLINPKALMYAEEKAMREDNLLEAVKADGTCLKFIPSYKQTKSIVIEAIKNNKKAAQHASSEIYYEIDKEIKEGEVAPS